jgi:hypothetical protein
VTLQAQSKTMLGTLAALSFALLSAAVVAFQIALVCGAPFGEMTLGGKYRGSLPLRVRVVPAVSACLLAGFAVVVAARAGLAFPAFAATSRTLVWIVIAYCAVGVLANYFTPSPRERMVWLPIVSLLLLTSVIVATS